MEEAAVDRKTRFKILIGSALGLGLSPIAPGTFAALLGVAIHVAIHTLTPPAAHLWLLIAAFLAVCVGNHVLTPWAEAYWKKKDPGNFVLDEVAGYLLVPILFRDGELWQVCLWGFLTFRFLDIVKVPPANYFDKHGTGAWGILLDDLVASAYAAGLLYLAQWLGPKLGCSNWLVS